VSHTKQARIEIR